MPSVNISVYLNDGEFSKFVKNKKEISNKARELVKSELV